MPTLEIIENPVLPVIQGLKECVKKVQTGRFDLFGPELQSTLGRRSIWSVVKDRGQQGAQHIGTGQGRGLFEQFDDFSLLVGIERPPFPAQQGPQRGGGYRAFRGKVGVESVTFGLTQGVHRVPVVNGDVKAIDDDLDLDFPATAVASRGFQGIDPPAKSPYL